MEPVIIEDLVRFGEDRGRAEGPAEGRLEGIAEGLARGLVVLMRQIERKLGAQ